MLLDESVNLGDISTSSFGTPLPAKGAPDFDEDSPITQPRFVADGDESEDGLDITPPSPLDDKVQAGSTEAGGDVTPKRERTPSPKANPEPQTPSRRPKIQITMEMESIVVSAKVGGHDAMTHNRRQGKDLGHYRRPRTTWIPISGGGKNTARKRDSVCTSFLAPT